MKIGNLVAFLSYPQLKHEPPQAIMKISSSISCPCKSKLLWPLSMTSSSRVDLERSAFGKAAIGREKLAPVTTFRNDTVTRPKGWKGVKTAKVKKAETNEEIMKRKVAAVKALRNHLNLSIEASDDILERHPRLYTHLPDLSEKLLYLLRRINIRAPHLKKMLLSHSVLMENVLMASEEYITNTIEVLRNDLDLSMKDIEILQSKYPAILSYPRSELRRRISVYTVHLGYSIEAIKNMVLNDPRMLKTNSNNVRRMLLVLEEELGVKKEDVHIMLGKEILLLTYNAEENIRPTIQFLKECEFGLSLGMVERKGVSTLSASTMDEKNQIIRSRLKTIIVGNPKILSSSLEKNLKPTVDYFVYNLTMSMDEFGKVAYRRGGTLLGANLERNIKQKIFFLRSELSLQLDAADDGLANNIQLFKVEVPHPNANEDGDTSNPEIKLSNFEKKRLLAQMLATVPDILTLSIENNLKPKFIYFTDTLGFNPEQVRFIILKRPQLLALSLERNIIPKVDYILKTREFITKETDATSYIGGLGMSKEELRKWIVTCPQSLTFSYERIRHRVFDVVKSSKSVGNEDNKVPMNFVTINDRSWVSTMDSWSIPSAKE